MKISGRQIVDSIFCWYYSDNWLSIYDWCAEREWDLGMMDYTYISCLNVLGHSILSLRGECKLD